VLLPQQIAFEDYFRGLRQRPEYSTALFPDVPLTGSVMERAAQPAAAIGAEFPNSEVHIVAHSMGGLDARYMIAQSLLDPFHTTVGSL